MSASRIAGLGIAAAVLAGGMSAAASEHRYAGETFTCEFVKQGRVVIDTREPGSSVTVRGRKYAASGGSYFYVSDDQPEVMVQFGPRMSYWVWGDTGERAKACVRRKNVR